MVSFWIWKLLVITYLLNFGSFRFWVKYLEILGRFCLFRIWGGGVVFFGYYGILRRLGCSPRFFDDIG